MLRSLLLILMAGACAGAADWPHWRGPNRDGTTPESSGWPGGWPPKKLWDRNVGRGCTSPVIVGDHLYVMGWQGDRRKGGTDTLYCLDARTGADVWKQSYPCRYQGRVRTGDTAAYGGPSSTPSFDPETGWLYTLSIDGDLQCWDTRDGGKRVWAMNLYDRFKAPQRPYVGGGRRDYGYPTSALILGDLAIVEVGAPDGTVMAFDKRTAERRWASQYRQPAGHTGGLVPMKVDGRDCLAVLTLQNLVVMRLDPGHEGETVATTPWVTEFACNIGTPAVRRNQVVVSSEYNHSETALFEIGKGAQRKWLSKSHALASSPVIYGDSVYLVKGPLQCVDLATGKLRWRSGDFSNGSCLITGDDKVIAFGSRKVALFEARPKGGNAVELARMDRVVRGTCYPHITLARGLLACKDRDGYLVVFSVRPVPDTTPPKLVSAHAAGDPTKLRVRFSEPVDAESAARTANYAVDYGVKVLAAQLSEDGRSVVLEVSPLREGGTYTLAVKGIVDRAPKPNSLPADSRAEFRFTPTRRVVDGLVALYDLEEGKGSVVRDVSGVGPALDLVIENVDLVQWIAGGLRVTGNVLIASRGAARKVSDACRQSNEITIEAWLTPADKRQSGPSRVVSLSEDPYKRNFTLGQERDRYDVRLRTTRTGENGSSPSTASRGGVATDLSHVVYTRSREGKARFYIDGKVNAERDIGGDLGNWDSAQRLALANELTADRPWRGELHLVAIYARALSAEDVSMNHQCGPEGGTRK